MKSKWKITVASAGLALTLLLSACQSAAPGQTPSAPSAATLANYINIDDARNAALQAASVTDSDVNVERVWLSGEGDTALYSVQFASPEGALYQYDVNAVTGEAKAVEPVDYERQKQEAALEREAEATAPGASAQPSASNQPAASARARSHWNVPRRSHWPTRGSRLRTRPSSRPSWTMKASARFMTLSSSHFPAAPTKSTTTRSRSATAPSLAMTMTSRATLPPPLPSRAAPRPPATSAWTRQRRSR